MIIKKAKDLKVGDRLDIGGVAHTVTYVGPYGDSYHSLIVSTDKSHGESFLFDKVEEIKILES